MLVLFVLEAKLRGSTKQFAVIDEMIRTTGFVRNSCIRHWMDNRSVGQYDLSALCAVLAREYEWAKKLNSQARQASAERAWQSIKRFYDNCQNSAIKKKGYPDSRNRALLSTKALATSSRKIDNLSLHFY